MESAVEIGPVEIRLVGHASLAVVGHRFVVGALSSNSRGFLNNSKNIDVRYLSVIIIISLISNKSDIGTYVRNLISELRGLLVHRVYAGRWLPGSIHTRHADSTFSSLRLIILRHGEVLGPSSSRLCESGLVTMLDHGSATRVQDLVCNVLTKATIGNRERPLVLASVKITLNDSLIVIAFI